MRFASLGVAVAAVGVRAETLTSPDTVAVAPDASPFAAARAPLTPQGVMASAAVAATRPRQSSALRFVTVPKQVPVGGPMMVGGTTSAGILDAHAFSKQSEPLRMEALIRESAVKSVEPKAKFIWLR